MSTEIFHRYHKLKISNILLTIFSLLSSFTKCSKVKPECSSVMWPTETSSPDVLPSRYHQILEYGFPITGPPVPPQASSLGNLTSFSTIQQPWSCARPPYACSVLGLEHSFHAAPITYRSLTYLCLNLTSRSIPNCPLVYLWCLSVLSWTYSLLIMPLSSLHHKCPHAPFS